MAFQSYRISEDMPYTEMIRVEGGTFLMGSEDDGTKEASKMNQPSHEVEIGDFYLGQFLITQELWERIMGPEDDRFDFVGSRHPADRISWYNAIEFCNLLSEKTGLSPVYDIDKQSQGIESEYNTTQWLVEKKSGANGYRLPTEAEWEFAARGGKYGKSFLFAGSNDPNEVGWYGYGDKKNSHNTTHDVGMKSPNELGFFDMSGNIYEWCWDWFDDYSKNPLKNPQGPETGIYRVLRGGAWITFPRFCYVFNREYGTLARQRNYRGFRVARSVFG